MSREVIRVRRKRFLSLLVAAVMLFCMLPVDALAATYKAIDSDNVDLYENDIVVSGDRIQVFDQETILSYYENDQITTDSPTAENGNGYYFTVKTGIWRVTGIEKSDKTISHIVLTNIPLTDKRAISDLTVGGIVEYDDVIVVESDSLPGYFIEDGVESMEGPISITDEEDKTEYIIIIKQGSWKYTGEHVYISGDEPQYTDGHKFERVYKVTLSGGEHATTEESAKTTQPGLGTTSLGKTPMEPVTYTAVEGYKFPEISDAYTTTAEGNHGIKVELNEDRTVITVSGTPTADVDITVPDAQIFYTVTFKVANGSWDDGDGEAATADRTVELTDADPAKLKLTAAQIPSAGTKPDTDYKNSGSWSPQAPSVETVISENTTYTFTYTAKSVATVTPPEANTLEYTGSALKLVTDGSTDGGTMQYALGTDADTAPTTGWDTEIPEGTIPGDYYVWYKVVGDGDYKDTAPQVVPVKINAAALTNVSVEQVGTLIYTGAMQTPEVSTTAIAKGEQSVTFTYSKTENGTYGPMPTVTDVADSGTFYYKATARYHNDAKGSFTVTMGGMKQSIDAQPVEAEYGEMDKKVEASVITPATGGGTITYAVKNGSENYIDVDSSNGDLHIKAVPPNDGKAYVTVTAAQIGNYAETTKDVLVTISKAANPLTYAETQTVEKDFSTTAQTATLAAASNGQGNVTYAIDSQKNSKQEAVEYFTLNGRKLTLAANTPVGTYSVVVKATAAGNDNYKSGTKNSTVTVKVKKADAVPATVTANNRNYDVTEKPLVTVDDSTLVGGEMWYALGTETKATETYSTSIPAKTDVGTYYVWYKVVGGDNYNDIAAQKVEAHITPATIDSVAAAGIDAPVANSALDTEATTTTSNVTLSAVTWEPNATQAAYATKYTATVTVSPKDENYAFADTVTATVNGKTAVATKNQDGTVSISYTFGKTALTPVTITPSDKDVAYTPDGIAIPVEGMFSFSDGAGKKTYSIVSGGTGEGTYSNGMLTVTKCGTFNVKVNTAKTTTHAAAEANATLTVNKAAPIFTAPKARTLTYTGKAQALIEAGSVTGGTMQYALDGKTFSETVPTGTDVGTYTVSYKVVGDVNHNDVAAEDMRVSIGKATPTVTAPMARPLTYTGEAQALVEAGSVTGGTMQYALDGKTFSKTIPTGTDLGTYIVSYKVIGDANHKDVEAQNVSVSIGKAAPTVTAPKARTLIYTGEAQALIKAGSVTGGTMQYALDGKTFSDAVPTGTDAGTYTVSYRVVGDTNHQDVAAKTVSVSIGKANAIVTAPKARTLIYTGEAQALIKAGSVTGGTMQYALDGKTFSDAVPTGTDAGNYTVSYKVIGDANHKGVAAKTVSVSIRSNVIVWDEEVLKAINIKTGEEFTHDGVTLVSQKGTAGHYSDGAAFNGYNFKDDSLCFKANRPITRIVMTGNVHLLEWPGAVETADGVLWTGSATSVAFGKHIDQITRIEFTLDYSGVELMPEADFVTPGAMKEIEEEAFEGISAENVRISDGVEALGSRAFANCPKLQSIYIPESVVAIADDLMVGCSNVTVYGNSDIVKNFAEAGGFEYVEVQ